MRQGFVIASLLYVVLLFAGASTGCAMGVDPRERAMARSQAVVHSGVRIATRDMERHESVTLPVRYNPCRCPAPDFEIHLYGKWQRILLEGDEDVLANFYAQAEEGYTSPGLSFYRLDGRLAGRDRHETGVEYPVFVVQGFSAQ